MNDIVAQALEHDLGVAGVEGVVIPADQGGCGLPGEWHSCVISLTDGLLVFGAVVRCPSGPP